jgi:hypothetical protein
MIRWLCYLPIRVLALLVNPLVAILVVATRVYRAGPHDNKTQTIEFAPYARDCFWWFSTNDDNSLWGDEGWREIHCRDHWKTPYGMWLWLRRNPAYGLNWHLLGAPIDQSKIVHLYGPEKMEHSRNETGVNKYTMGEYFQYKKVAKWPWSDKFGWMIQTGWILDAYTNGQELTEPKAIYQFEIRFVKFGN